MFPLVRQLHELVRTNSADEKKYQRYMESLKSSTLTAFYTPYQIPEAIKEALEQAGVRPDRILDPAAGTGIFGERLSSATFPTETVYFERDLLTSKILSKLRSGSTVIADSFQSVAPEYLDYFDVVASNIPFGNTAVYDRIFDKSDEPARRLALGAVHDYFFIKGVDVLREGGILAYVTSQGVMDAPSNEPVRRWLMQHADLLSAVRLPNDLFTDFAGTQVGTDLIVLQKHSDKTQLSESEQAFICTATLPVGITQNELFRDQSRIIYTSQAIDKDLYGSPAMVFTHSGGPDAVAGELRRMLTEDFGQRLDTERFRAFQKPLPQDLSIQAAATAVDTVPEPPVGDKRTIPEPVIATAPAQVPQRRRKPRAAVDSLFRQGDLFSQPPETEPAPGDLDRLTQENLRRTEEIARQRKEALEPRPFTGTMLPHYVNGSLVEQNGRYGFLRQVGAIGAMFYPEQYTTMQRYRAEGYIPLRDAYQALYREEQYTQAEQPELRAELNRLYDDFIRTIGDLNGKDNAKFILTDACGREILALERYVDGRKQKADIFTAPVSINSNSVSHVDTPQEALAASLNLYGNVSLDYMAAISGRTEDELIRGLEGRICFNPLIGRYEPAELFLSGNVIVKADEMQVFLSEHPQDERVQASLTALRESFPQPVPFGQLDVNFGERWIPIILYKQFVVHFFQIDWDDVIIRYAPKIDQYEVLVKTKNALITDKFCVVGDARKYDGVNLLTHALHNTVPDITKEVGRDENDRPIRVRDMEKVQLADAKINEMREAFVDWLRAQPEKTKQGLADLYNRKFNCYVRARYDSSHQTFPGLDLKGLGIEKLYDSQRDAV